MNPVEHPLMEVMHQVLAFMAAQGVDHVAAPVVAERVQAFLYRDIQRNVFRLQVVFNCSEWCLNDYLVVVMTNL